MRRVLIAGCGYVGTALAQVLMKAQLDVWGLRRTPSSLPEGIHRIAADLCDRATLDDLPQPLDAVVFCAAADAGDDDAYAAIYVQGLRNLVDALSPAPPKHFVLISSTAVYGQNHGELVDESSVTEPRRFAGRRMLESEAVAARAQAHLTIVRAAGIYGPGRTGLLDRVYRGDIELGEGPSYTNRIHRDDLAGFIAHAMLGDANVGIYIAADDDPADRSDVVRWLAPRLGMEPPSRRADVMAAPNKRCSNARMRSTGYALRYPSYREGYVEIVDRYLRERGVLN